MFIFECPIVKMLINYALNCIYSVLTTFGSFSCHRETRSRFPRKDENLTVKQQFIEY